jgi:hypothetical protein
VIDAEAMLAAARRPLVIGIGGGGDVVGALATAEACRIYHGASPVVGGTTWERMVIDSLPGPRPLDELEGDPEHVSPCVAIVDGATHTREVVFAEARMAQFLGERTLIVDPNFGPAIVADGVRRAFELLDGDLLVFVDVGGDMLAHGDELGLSSPLCDAVMLAAAGRLQEAGLPVLAGLFGVGCDGELTADEVMARVAEVAAAGGLAGVHGLTEAVAERLEAAVEVVPTEASAQALRCFRGETGVATIRRGRRTVPLSPVGALTFYFDPLACVRSAARLAAAVWDAGDLAEANDALNALGVVTELDTEQQRFVTGDW